MTRRWQVVFTGRRERALRDAIAAAGDPFGDIAQQFRVRAAVQLTRNRDHYLASWKDHLPADFVAAATAIYDRYTVSLAGGDHRAD